MAAILNKNGDFGAAVVPFVKKKKINKIKLHRIRT